MSTEVACVMNIGPRQRARRRRWGLAWLLVGAIATAALFVTGIARPWRAALFVPLVLSAYGFFQARERTCVSLAARGLRDLGDGVHRVTDEAERRAVRRKVARVHAQSLVAAAILTAAALLAP